MFDTLLSFWRGKDFLTQVLGDFKQMLDHAENMFAMVSQALLDNKAEPDLREKVYSVDKEINQLERGIRQRIIEHLSLQPSVNTSSCLCLMSVVKDAERLGDYTKNLYEVIGLLDKPINREIFAEYFDDLDKEILTLFRQTKEAFIESDDNKAKSSWEVKTRLAKECDTILAKVVKSDLGTNRGICYALMARYFKRIIAHLVNIATSVVLPISDLDYFDEKRAENYQEDPPEI